MLHWPAFKLLHKTTLGLMQFSNLSAETFITYVSIVQLWYLLKQELNVPLKMNERECVKNN